MKLASPPGDHPEKESEQPQKPHEPRQQNLPMIIHEASAIPEGSQGNEARACRTKGLSPTDANQLPVNGKDSSAMALQLVSLVVAIPLYFLQADNVSVCTLGMGT